MENKIQEKSTQYVEQKEKHKINWWLEDSDFLAKAEFHDHYYLESVCKHVANMIKNIPIPVLTSYDPKNKSIYFSVGKIKKDFKLDVNIAYYDYITIVKRYLYQFFPTYNIEYEKEVDLSEDEIWEKVNKEKMNLNDAIMCKKKTKVKEKGVIEKEVRLKDEFIINVNGKRQVRITGSLQFPMSLSTFMSKLKLIKNDKKRYDFIFENSTFIKDIGAIPKQDILITYSGNQLLNFFKINFEDLKGSPLIQIDTFTYKWGVFRIKFESQSLKTDCLNYYEKEKSKLGK